MIHISIDLRLSVDECTNDITCVVAPVVAVNKYSGSMKRDINFMGLTDIQHRKVRAFINELNSLAKIINSNA